MNFFAVRACGSCTRFSPLLFVLGFTRTKKREILCTFKLHAQNFALRPNQPAFSCEQILIGKIPAFLHAFCATDAENRRFGGMVNRGAPLSGRAATGSAVASAPDGACCATLRIPGAFGGRS